MINKFKKVTMMMAACFMVLLFFGNVASFAAEPSNKVIVSVKQAFSINGTEKAPSDEFTYKLTAKQNDSPMPSSGDTFTMKGQSAGHSVEILFEKEGDYTYTLEQIKDETWQGYSFADEVYTIEVHVRKNSSNVLVATPVVRNQKGEKPVDKVFTCSYNSLDDKRCLSIDPPVRKSIKGKPAKAETFEFVLKASDLSNPMPAGSQNGEKSITITGNGTKEFGKWEYTAAGTYVYTVSEKNTGKSDYNYDANVYTITDTVTDNNGQLVLNSVITDKDGNKITGTIEYEFVNEYTGTETVEPTPTTLEGNGNGGKEGKDDGGSNGGGIFGPKTGDFFNKKQLMITLFGGAAVAIAALCWIVAAKRKNRKEEE